MRSKIVNRNVLMFSIYFILIIIIISYQVFLPFKEELKIHLLNNFEQTADMGNGILKNNIIKNFEHAINISNGSFTHNEYLKNKDLDHVTKEMKKTTQLWYREAAKSNDKLVRAERYLNDELFNDYYLENDEHFIGVNDYIWHEPKFIHVAEYELVVKGDNQFISILSPITLDGKRIGYDKFLFDISYLIDDLTNDQIDTNIISENEYEQLIKRSEIINEENQMLFFSKNNIFYKIYNLTDSFKLVVSQKKSDLLKPLNQTINNILIKGFSILIVYILGSYIFTLWYTNKKLCESKVNLNEAISKINTDELTTVNSRVYGENLLKEKFSEFQHTLKSPIILFFDIDNLKEINDTYGHIAGDVVIRVIAQKIKENMSENDALFRWGGDEFIGVFDDIKEEFLQFKEKLSKEISEIVIDTENEQILVSASIGYSYFDKKDTLYTEAVDRADRAMYDNKHNKKMAKRTN